MTKKIIYHAHIIIIAISASALLMGCFQSSLWFDEAYTVGMMSNSLGDIMRIAVYDVHPHLYYVVLKLVTLIFGGSLYTMRLFSAVGAVVFVLLGFTHIRKDFGEKIGFWFSFTAAFTAITFTFGTEIRMYSWACCLVCLAAVYAYRLAKNENAKKNRILFALFSILAAYTHYFGLFAAAALNIALFVQHRKRGEPLKSWLIAAAVQLGCYVPGGVVLFIQVKTGGAYWMQVLYPDVVFDLTSYHLLGKSFGDSFDRNVELFYQIGVAFTAVYVLAGVLLYRYAKRADNEVSAALKWAARIYYGVIVFALAISLARPMYYIRYTYVLYCFPVFFIAVLIASRTRIWQKALIAVMLVSICTYQVFGIYSLIFDSSGRINSYLDERIEESDVFLFEDFHAYTVSVHYTDNTVYYYNINEYSVEKAYEAFAKESIILANLEEGGFEDFSGRIWVVGDGDCLSYLLSLDGYEIKSRQWIDMLYEKQKFEIILVERTT